MGIITTKMWPRLVLVFLYLLVTSGEIRGEVDEIIFTCGNGNGTGTGSEITDVQLAPRSISFDLSSRFDTHAGLNSESVNQQKYIEVLVVVDDTMEKYHENDLYKYVQSLMVTAAKVYADPSIGTQIKLAVKGIHILKKDLRVKPVKSAKGYEGKYIKY